MPYFHEFIMLTIIHFLAVMSPGPDFAIVLRQSISFGRKTAIITSLGIGAGISVHVLYTLLGVGILISQSDSLMIVAKILGAAYITYLAFNLLRSKAKPDQSSSICTVSLRAMDNCYYSGLVLFSVFSIFTAIG